MSINLATLCNTRTLTELTQLLKFMSDETYQKQTVNQQGIALSSIGTHCRHVIEFYQCFFQGLQKETIDYDARRRNPQIERSKDHAILQLDSICEMLGMLPTVDTPDTFTLKTQIDSELAAITCETHVVRELVFLQSHSVHHMALISVLLNSYGQSTPNNFGLANSTRIFLKKQKVD